MATRVRVPGGWRMREKQVPLLPELWLLSNLGTLALSQSSPAALASLSAGGGCLAGIS